MPEVATVRRLSFFYSYYALTLAVVGAFLIGVLVAPQTARVLFGATVDVRPLPFLVAFMPLPLFFFAGLAALKAVMHVALAQTLMRAVTVAACCCYGVFFLVRTAWFREHAGIIIFTVYFTLMLVVTIVVAVRMRKTFGRLVWRDLSWCLPPGFWWFMVGVQGASILGFLHLKLDQIVVLRSLNVSQLGIYFLAVQLAESMPLLVGFFLEGVLPGFTNWIALKRPEKVSELYAQTSRHLMLMVAFISFSLVVFARPLLRIFGTQYAGAWAPLVILLIANCADAMTLLNSAYLVAWNRSMWWSLIQLVRLVSFIGLFWLLPARETLTGVALARGVAWLAASVLSFVAMKLLKHAPAVPRVVVPAISIVGLLAAAVFSGMVQNAITGALALVAALSVFWLVAGYGLHDIRYFVSLFSSQRAAESH